MDQVVVEPLRQFLHMSRKFVSDVVMEVAFRICTALKRPSGREYTYMCNYTHHFVCGFAQRNLPETMEEVHVSKTSAFRTLLQIRIQVQHTTFDDQIHSVDSMKINSKTQLIGYRLGNSKYMDSSLRRMWITIDGTDVFKVFDCFRDELMLHGSISALNGTQRVSIRIEFDFEMLDVGRWAGYVLYTERFNVFHQYSSQPRGSILR